MQYGKIYIYVWNKDVAYYPLYKSKYKIYSRIKLDWSIESFQLAIQSLLKPLLTLLSIWLNIPKINLKEKTPYLINAPYIRNHAKLSWFDWWTSPWVGQWCVLWHLRHDHCNDDMELIIMFSCIALVYIIFLNLFQLVPPFQIWSKERV